MKLKEGMYIKTKLNDFCNMVAIRKIDEIDEDDDNKFWIDDYIIDTFGDEQNKLSEEDVDKASYNLIDLIEVGDYVNGKRVYNISIVDGLKYLDVEVEDYLSDMPFINADQITSIVTKEQFASVKYEVK